MAAFADDTIECGFCLRKNEALEEPKVLPCTHVHCLKCLIGFYEVNHMLQCPVPNCRQVTEVQVNSLPSHDTSTHSSTQCDSCKKNGDAKKAVVYCTQCDMKYCTSHLKSHDDLHADHVSMKIEDYKVKVKRFEVRECVNHKGQQYTVGCKVCLTVCCVECLSKLGNCVNEKSHDLLSLGQLVATLVDEDIKAKMVAKEEKLESLFKLTSKVNSEYDAQTSELVETLKRMRNEQLKVIKEKYDQLEKELVEKRKEKRLELVEFLEDSVLKRWTALRNHRLRIESRIERSHQVDIVKGYQELKEEVKKLVEEVLPRLDMVDVGQLKTKAAVTDIELEITPYRLDIHCDHGAPSVHQLPMSMALLQTVNLSAGPLSVCEYKGDVYVGLDKNGVAKIDSNYQVSESFISCTGRVESVTVYEDRVYTLLYQSPSVMMFDDYECYQSCNYIVSVYDMSGNQVTQWTHTTTGGYFTNRYHNVLSVVSDQLVIAGSPDNRITINSLTGDVLRYIPCSLLGDSHMVQCTVDDTSIVISDYSTSKVFRLNIASGEVMWTHSTSGSPQGITTCYDRKYLIVTFDNSNTAQILDINTGEKISELTDTAMGGAMYGLTFANRLLVVAKYSTPSVLFFD